MTSNPWREGFEVIVFRTVNDQPTLWDSILPPELLVLPAELGRVDALLDDPVFFAPFAAYFDARIGRPSIPMETYLRLMFLKFRYRLGYESLCREVSDSISWQRFCRIPFGTRVPHPTTLMKITTRCGDGAVTGLNEALLAKAAGQKLLRTDKVRADTTVVTAAVAYPTDSGLLAKAVGSVARTITRIHRAGGATRTRVRDRSRSAGRRARSIASKLRLRGAQQREEVRPRLCGSPGNWPGSLTAWCARPLRWCAMPAAHCVPRPGRVRAGCVGRSTTWTRCCSARSRWWLKRAVALPG
jgi:IS5 family transposase